MAATIFWRSPPRSANRPPTRSARGARAGFRSALTASSLCTASRPAGVRMRYWNADGLSAALCINGTRCAARLALHLGWSKASFPVTTDAGTVRGARRRADRDRAAASGARRASPEPRARGRRQQPTKAGSSPSACRTSFSSGPSRSRTHRSPSSARRCAPTPSSRPAAPTSTSCASRLRTGWRSAASSAASKPRRSPAAPASSRRPPSALLLNLAQLPLSASTLGGFTLTVDGQTVDSALRNWSLAGDARILGSVELTPEAGLPAPPAPHWSV